MQHPILAESIIDPELPIIDAHHHLWLRTPAELAAMDTAENLMAQTLASTFGRHARYLLDEFLADLNTGHHVIATVYIQVHTMYRIRGPEPMRSLGEVEFANGIAAMAASGLFGETAVCAGIVGAVDLRLGEAAEVVMEAHQRAGGGRYRGIRDPGVAYDDDQRNLGKFGGVPHLLLDSKFRAGFKQLERLGLSYDAWQLEYQLEDLIDLARAFPGIQIVVNHVGGLFGVGGYSGRTEERFARWRENIRALSHCPNVTMKLGGLGMPTCGFGSSLTTSAPDSEHLAGVWAPYIETCIEVFGAHRCMFESNFPVDAATTSYPVLWNAFKRITSGASKDERAALFSGTAKRFYRLDV